MKTCELLIYQGKFVEAQMKITQLPILERYVLQSKLHEKKGEFILAEEFANLAIKYAQNISERIAATVALLYALWRQSRYTECHIIFDQLPSNLPDTETTAKLYNIMGLVYWSEAKYNGKSVKPAIAFHQRSLQIRTTLKNIMGQSFSYNNLGNAYLLLQQYDDALNYYLNALAIRENLQMNAEVATTLRDIGRLYQQQQKYALAIDYYNRAKIIREQLGNPYDLKKINDSIDNLHID